MASCLLKLYIIYLYTFHQNAISPVFMPIFASMFGELATTFVHTIFYNRLTDCLSSVRIFLAILKFWCYEVIEVDSCLCATKIDHFLRVKIRITALRLI